MRIDTSMSVERIDPRSAKTPWVLKDRCNKPSTSVEVTGPALSISAEEARGILDQNWLDEDGSAAKHVQYSTRNEHRTIMQGEL